MTLIAYDSASPRLIPASAEAVLPYSDGHYRWSNLERPRARWRYITVLGDPDADIADVEPGCIWPPARAAIWAQDRLDRHPGADLTIYCDRDVFPAVDDVMTRYGWRWQLFLSTLDGTKPTSYRGKPTRAVQFTDRSNAYDMSIVYDLNWLNKAPE